MTKLRMIAIPLLLACGASGLVIACGSDGGSGGGQPTGDGGNGGTDGPAQGTADGSFAKDGGPSGADGGDSGVNGVHDPVDCTEAKINKSSIGCDFWPTVTANGVWSIFDFAVVVTNAGTATANVTVTGGALTTTKNVAVAPGSSATIYLPWVPELKGPDWDECGAVTSTLAATVMKTGGAYHLVSSSPVSVQQFNAMENKGVGGPPQDDGGAKDWSSCPGSAKMCMAGLGSMYIGCFSFSNDASLLLPTTALSLTYRVTGHPGWTVPGLITPTDILGSYVTLTATEDATQVTLTLPATATILAGGGIAATTGGQLVVPLAKAGDVVQLMLEKGDKYDLSGALVQSSKPLQVIAGTPCLNVPESASACDHVEETVVPAETLGKHYVVTMPDSPQLDGGTDAGAGKGVARFYGNRDGTALTYNPAAPTGCPTTLSAGQVVECALGSADFEVTGNNELAVAIFSPGGSAYGVSSTEGDPAQSTFTPVEQWRTKYAFFAPTVYDLNRVDIVGPSSAAPTIDGAAVSVPWTPIGGGPYGVWRVLLRAGPTGDGRHVLTSAAPVGAQVLGFGSNNAYQYPAGMNLSSIAPLPPK